MICKHYFVFGRVQGVFYRGCAQKQAKQLGLKGWVRNLADGRVELLVCTPGDLPSGRAGEDLLMEFEKWLEIGPEYAKVTNIESTNEDIDDIIGELADVFQIRATPY